MVMTAQRVNLFTKVVHSISIFFFFNDTATTEIYTLSLHDALPISCAKEASTTGVPIMRPVVLLHQTDPRTFGIRSEEHTSELQSQSNLVCRLLLEKKKNIGPPETHIVNVSVVPVLPLSITLPV